MSIILTLACNHFCDEPILSNNKLKEELGISGRNFVMKKYSWNASVCSKDSIEKFIKRLIDITLGTMYLFLSLPIWIAYYFYIKIVSPGPVIYKMERLGQNGTTFNMYKFRTMVIDADEKLNEILKIDEKLRKEFNENYKLKSDPRIIKYGNLFRKFSIDEIPQLINILKGDMSLVGPRPIVKLELEKYEENKNTFLSVKPGLTGLWQISGRSELSYDDRIILDINYIENWSIWMDIEILLKTAKVILTGYGAV